MLKFLGHGSNAFTLLNTNTNKVIKIGNIQPDEVHISRILHKAGVNTPRIYRFSRKYQIYAKQLTDQFYDFIEDPLIVYNVAYMEYVPGDIGVLELNAKQFTGLVHNLKKIHEAGFIFWDLHEDNFIVNGDNVHIIDFGLTRRYFSEGADNDYYEACQFFLDADSLTDPFAKRIYDMYNEPNVKRIYG